MEEEKEGNRPCRISGNQALGGGRERELFSIWKGKLLEHCIFNPRLTEIVTQLTKGEWYPQIFKMNHRMMLILVPVVSFESALNIDAKISTNMPSVWLL